MFRDKRRLLERIPELAVVGVSKWITNEAKKSILSNAKHIDQIYNWVDTDIFKPTESSIIKKRLGIKDKFVILGVASFWGDSKGLGEYKELAKRLDDSSVIVLVGKMPKNEVLPHNIISIRNTNDVQELVGYYSMADVFVNLSIEETFGKVTAEALSCGTPVIVYNTTACPELAPDGCGGIAELHDLDRVCDLIANIREKSKEYFTGSCIEFSHKAFNKDECISKYYQLYEKLI
ncbi:MAG: glycosyltransferase [Oscillospiraceae bacterium]|nr:glycosyltransferase [Oscillospiraceae bacterium]